MYNLLRNHFRYTKSKNAKKIIDNLSGALRKFVKVIPVEYKHILDSVILEESLNLKEPLDG